MMKHIVLETCRGV